MTQPAILTMEWGEIVAAYFAGRLADVSFDHNLPRVATRCVIPFCASQVLTETIPAPHKGRWLCPDCGRLLGWNLGWELRDAARKIEAGDDVKRQTLRLEAAWALVVPTVMDRRAWIG